MRENVGTFDRALRGVVGPCLVVIGYSRLGGRYGSPLGLLSMAAGAAVIESAITRVCPLNASLGIDSRSSEKKIQDAYEAIEPAIDDLDFYEQVVAVQEEPMPSSLAR